MTKTSCPKGHPYDAVNTIIRIRKGKEVKECRVCSTARVNKWRAEHIAQHRKERIGSDANYYQKNAERIKAARRARYAAKTQRQQPEQ